MSAPKALFCSCCAFVLLAFAPAAATASVGWRTATPPYAASGDADGTSLAYDPLGDLYASAYVNNGNARIRTRPPGGDWSELATPTAVTAFPQLGFDALGNAVYVNTSSSTDVSGGYKPVGQPFGSPTTIGTRGSTGVYPYGVAVNDSGAALTAFADSTGKLAVRDRPAGAGSSFATTTVDGGTSPDAGGPGGIFPPVIFPVLDPNGAGVVLYSVQSQSGVAFKQVTRSATGAFGAPTDLGTAYSPSLAVNRAGDAVLLSHVIAAQATDSDQVYASYRPRGGSFGPFTLVGAQGVAGSLPSAAVLPDGHVVVAWESRHPGCNSTQPDRVSYVSVRERSPGAAGTWSAAPDVDGSTPTLAASDATDRFVLGFVRPVDECDQTGLNGPSGAFRVLAGFGTAAGGLDSSSITTLPQDVTAQDVNYAPNVAMDRSGNAFLTYTDDFGPSGAKQHVPKAVAYEDGSTPVPPPPTEPIPQPVPPNDGSNPSGHLPPDDSPPFLPGNGDPSKPYGPAAVGLKASEVASTGLTFKGIPLAPACAGGCSIQADGHTFAVWSYDAPVQASAARARVHRVTVKLKRFRATVKPGKRAHLTIPVPKRAKAAAHQALLHHGKLRAVLVIHSSATPKPFKVTVTFKRKR
jgi:hypothetical protein